MSELKDAPLDLLADDNTLHEISPLMRDVTLVFCLNVMLSVPFAGAENLWGGKTGPLIAAYVAIAGTVLSLWGIYLSAKAGAAGRLPMIAFFYLVCFVAFSLCYGAAALSLIRGH